MFNRTGRAQCPERLSVSIYLRQLTGCYPPRAQSNGASLRNAVAGAMRGHIKPVMVPFSRAITRPVVISPVIASATRRLCELCPRARTFLPPQRRLPLLFHCFHIAPHRTARPERERERVILRNSHTWKKFDSFIKFFMKFSKSVRRGKITKETNDFIRAWNIIKYCP